ncbi:hypothetical protein [Candidatus Protofrankia californiensis]|uniref:hypothetical protein n=1 Tax=Candidatus Protofrankia californiensis TaxID=1839754 RepID=UPI001F496796|nr:hypothetical protein [Candidatus Protofrankia californiensis]
MLSKTSFPNGPPLANSTVCASCGRTWLRSRGPALTGVLLGLYGGVRRGAPAGEEVRGGPSVLTVTVAAATASYLLADCPD